MPIKKNLFMTNLYFLSNLLVLSVAKHSSVVSEDISKLYCASLSPPNLSKHTYLNMIKTYWKSPKGKQSFGITSSFNYIKIKNKYRDFFEEKELKSFLPDAPIFALSSGTRFLSLFKSSTKSLSKCSIQSLLSIWYNKAGQRYVNRSGEIGELARWP